MKSKQETIKLVTESLSSIFSKDDVLKMLSELPESNSSVITQETINNIADQVSNDIDSMKNNIIELDSVNVTAGSYGSSIDDYEFSLNESRISEIVIDAISQHLEVE